ncbi:hypothetical protein [Candidatus Sororendozoicomonas aggregata]|uniref:hypothetical protein n=1 Tax=Candidatus Sororendozoicomonas aggregata TaxID=3073239 RepID=UPI002ED4C3F5
MSEETAFKIQLGLTLPKIKEKLGNELHAIVEELALMFRSGNTESDDDVSADLEAIKAIFLKDMDIYLDKEVIPVLKTSLAPEPEESSSEDAQPEEAATDEEAGEPE